MPNIIVTRLMEEVSALKADVANLKLWHKWEMGILAAILIKAYWQ